MVFPGAEPENGDYGVDLWLDLRAAIGYRVAAMITMTREPTTVVHKHPRLMVAVVHNDVCTTCYVVGHVPLDDGETWWMMLEKVMNNGKVREMEKVRLIDANGSVAADAGRYRIGLIHGGHFCTPVSSTAGISASWGVTSAVQYEKQVMWLPSTCEEYAAAAITHKQGTFQAGTRKKKDRVDTDYVASSQQGTRRRELCTWLT